MLTYNAFAVLLISVAIPSEPQFNRQCELAILRYDQFYYQQSVEIAQIRDELYQGVASNDSIATQQADRKYSQAFSAYNQVVKNAYSLVIKLCGSRCQIYESASELYYTGRRSSGFVERELPRFQID